MKKNKNPFHFLVYLGLLSIVGFLATDMYLPAFDRMHTDLGTSKAVIGASLSVYLGAFGLAQLFWGPISDKFGKPKAIFAGMTLFAISSLLIFFTHNIVFFLVLRVLQAIGACAAAVSWQALVIERYPESETGKIFASIMPLVALSPALAPLLGVFILEHGGWRPIFLVLAGISFLLLAYSLTLKKGNIKYSAGIEKKVNYLSFLKYKDYVGNVLIYGFCSAGFFAWLTGAPFFLKELGYNESQIGWSFVPQTIAFMAGGYGLRIFADKLKEKKVLPILLITYAICMFVILILAIFTTPTLTELLIPFCIMAFTNGATYPIVVNQALKPFPKSSGKASALLNTLQMSINFIASTLVSIFSHQALMATAIVMAATAILTLWVYKFSKKSGDF